jgi:glycine cleavage system P protein (glycine dehydrogenase) subunit 1
MADLGEGIMLRARYAAVQIGQIPGVGVPFSQSPHFQEFVVNFDGTGRTVAEIHTALLARGIFGGKDLSGEFPELGQSALYCVTEVHTQADIDRLVPALEEVLR